MNAFTVPALYNMAALISLALLLGGLVLVIPRQDDVFHRKAIVYFAYYFICLCFSFVFYTLKDQIGLLYSVILTNAFALTSVYMLYAGFAYRFEQGIQIFSNYIYWGNLVCLVGAQLSLALWVEDSWSRVLLLCINIGVVNIAVMMLVYKYRSPENPGDIISLFALYFNAACMLVFVPGIYKWASEFGVYDKFILIIFQLSEVAIFGGIITGYLYDLVQQYYRESITDSMTGVHNRGYFYQQAQRYIASVRRYREDVTLVICDIDKFKDINDQLGHDAGDRAIIAFAQTLKSNIREEDLLARFGGEEFILLLPKTSLRQSEPVVERMRQCTKTVSIMSPKGGAHLTVSFGVAQWQSHLDLEELVKKADEALYLAKENGRDRIEYSALDSLIPVSQELTASHEPIKHV